MKRIFVFSTIMSLLLAQQADIFGLAPFHANKTLVDLAGEARGRLAGRDIDKESLQDMAVWELLKVLGFHDQEEIAKLTLATWQMGNGYRMVKIRIPNKVLSVAISRVLKYCIMN